jgi:hypothetical protein
MNELFFFEFKHLPPSLQLISNYYYDMASEVIDKLPDNEQRNLCLQRLLESKDCAVRSLVISDQQKQYTEKASIANDLIDFIKGFHNDYQDNLGICIKGTVFPSVNVDDDRGGGHNT